MKNLLALFCVDVEPDRPFFGGKRYDYFGHQKWEGARKRIPEFLTFKQDLEKSLNCSIHFTWFFRADSQIAEMYNHNTCYSKWYKEIVDTLLQEGEEVGWHVHTWRWSKERNSWYQEINDDEWIKSCYKNGFSDFKDILGFAPTSFRAGWGFHNNVSMSQLEELGIKVDLSALPGIKNSGEKNAEGSLFNGFADWERTDIYPYQPSKEDYQISSENHYRLLEIPMTTFKKPLISYINQGLPISFKEIPEIRY